MNCKFRLSLFLNFSVIGYRHPVTTWISLYTANDTPNTNMKSDSKKFECFSSGGRMFLHIPGVSTMSHKFPLYFNLAFRIYNWIFCAQNASSVIMKYGATSVYMSYPGLG